MTRLLVLLLLAAGGVWAARSWRRGLEAALLLVVVEGAMRKWLVPEAADFVYFGKDLLLLGVYWGFLRDPVRRRVARAVPPGLVLALGIAASVALLECFNPRLPGILVGVLGFKAYFFYVPLLWVVPGAFRDERALANFLKRYLLLAIPVGLLALAQFFSPADSWINTYARSGGPEGSGTIITFGAVSNVRVTGTFSFITGYSSFLQVCSLLALTVLTVRGWRIRGNLLVLAAFAVTVLGMLMAGSRGPVLLLILLLPLYWLFGVVREGGVPGMGRFLLALALVFSVVNVVGSDAVEAFRARAAGTSDVWGRITGPFLTPLRIAPEIGLIGYGTGATHQMAEAVVSDMYAYSWLEGYHFEDEPSRVMVELGILGFLAFFAARAALAGLALVVLFRARRPLPRAVALSCLLLFLAQFIGGVVFNVTADVYYWFFGGLLFLADRLDREAKAASRAQARHRRAVARRGAPPAAVEVAG